MKLTNLLIDEFQDTSHMQWHNLRPLVANALAEDSDNLIIGDVKQAIYRRISGWCSMKYVIMATPFLRSRTSTIMSSRPSTVSAIPTPSCWAAWWRAGISPPAIPVLAEDVGGKALIYLLDRRRCVVDYDLHHSRRVGQAGGGRLRHGEQSESPEAPGAKPRYATADDITAFNSRFNYLCGQGAAAAEAIITARMCTQGRSRPLEECIVITSTASVSADACMAQRCAFLL